MKSPAAYYLFLLYMVALCKPVMPIIQDVIAHTFFEHQHLASVHEKSGGNHVGKEIGKLAENEKSNSTSLKLYDEVQLHFITSFEFSSYTSLSISLLHSSCYTSSLSAIPLAIQLPPPKV